jgi:branched-chain amino acid aminotransferase
MIKQVKFIWKNGELILWNEAKIHILSHSLHYGSGVMEGLRLRNTLHGPAIFKLQEHINRLYKSAAALHMDIPFSKKILENAVINLIKANKITNGYIRPITYYSYGSMSLNPIGSPVEVAIACWPWGKYLGNQSLNLKTSNYIRIHPRSTITNAKICGNYINSVLATLEIANTKYDEVLFLDFDGNITEGAGENIFIAKNNIIYTPFSKNIFPGITRQTVFDILNNSNFILQEKNLNLDDVYTADEVFLTGTAIEIAPVNSVDDILIANGKAGEITRFVLDTYTKMCMGKNEKTKQNLTFINGEINHDHKKF